jgi:negative regulator of flagellin synthesis FlgM
MDIGSQLQGLQQSAGVSPAERTQAVEPHQGAVAAGAGAAGESGNDETHLSSAARLVHQTLSLPDVRAGKVAEMQQALASGSYNVSSSAVAEKLIGSMLER